MPSVMLLNHRMHNLLHTVVLLGGLVSLVFLLGWIFAGVYGIIWAGLIGIIPLFVSVRLFPSMILKMYRARPLAADEAPRLFEIVGELGSRAGLTVPPRLHYIASNAVLIFSVGHGKEAAIALSYGLMRLFTLRELVGVLAHEISHIRNNDTWVMSFADVVSRITHIISLLGLFLVLINLPMLIFTDYSIPWAPLLLMLFAPIASALLQLALSRTREFDADLQAARFSGDPKGLAAALAKLEENQMKITGRGLTPGHRGAVPSLLRSHPATSERIRRLIAYEEEMRLHRAETVYGENGHLSLPDHMTESDRKPRRRLSGLWY